MQALGISDQLKSGTDPAYAGPRLPAAKEKKINPQFPWWFGYGVDRSKLPPPPPPAAPASPPPVGIPGAGPYTVLAPTNEAFEQLLANLAGPGAKKKMSVDDLLKLPEAKNILTYHVLPGNYSTGG
jgi:hypothetical protein